MFSSSEVASLNAMALEAVHSHGNYVRAVDLLTQAIKLERNSAGLYHNRGMALARLERLDEATEDFTHAIDLEPHPLAFEERAKIYYRLGDRANARADFHSALDLDSDRSDAWFGLGWLYFEDGENDVAIHCFTNAIDIEPTNAGAYRSRALAYHSAGMDQLAHSDLDLAERLVNGGLDTSRIDRVE